MKIYYDLHYLSKNLPRRIEVAMTGENEWKPSRWTPPADLEEAFEDGRSTKKLPDGSTAVLSWAPEMDDRWWSYDGALGDRLNIGPDTMPESTHRGNGIMLASDSEIEELLSTATIMDPVGQPWSYNPIETGILREPADFTTLISWIDLFPSIFVSHDGRIAFVDWTDSSNFIMEIIDTDEQHKFYIDRLFKLLPKYLDHNKRKLNKRHIVCDRVQLQSLEKWILSLPTWVSIIIGSRLADAGSLSLLTTSSTGMFVEQELINDPYNAIAVASRCSRLSEIANEQIYDNDGDSASFDQLVLEYGPCWLMQVLLALDNHPDDDQFHLDLTRDDQWRDNTNRDRVLEACRLAGAMNAPIELWPRFYSIIENRDSSKLDETEVLMLLAAPIKNWAALEEAESIARGHGELVREACCLATAIIANLDSVNVHKLEDVQRAIVKSLDSDRPIAGQTVDLTMELDDVIDGTYPISIGFNTTLNDIPRLLTGKPEMTGTINGASLIVRDLNRMNVNEN